MPRFSHCRPAFDFAAVAACWFFVCAMAVAEPPTPPPAWREATLSLMNEANAGFRQGLETKGTKDRLTRFGYAATLINVQPKTDGNLDEAVRVLQGLIDEAPKDDISLSARYLIGRVAQVHRLDPDLPAAAAAYRELLREFPENPIAQRALPKLALILLFDPNATPGDDSAAKEVEAMAGTLTDSRAIRDTRLVLAEYYTRIAPDDAKALENLRIAYEQGIQRSKARGSILVRIAELSRRLGKSDQARNFYQAFLDSYQRDTRRTLIEERLKNLPTTPE